MAHEVGCKGPLVSNYGCLLLQAKEARDVDDIAGQLERLEGPVNLDWKTSRSSPDTSPMDRLAGRKGWQELCLSEYGISHDQWGTRGMRHILGGDRVLYV